MEYHDKEYCLEVWGDFACFTRPELKVERVSYDVITDRSVETNKMVQHQAQRSWEDDEPCFQRTYNRGQQTTAVINAPA